MSQQIAWAGRNRTRLVRSANFSPQNFDESFWPDFRGAAKMHGRRIFFVDRTYGKFTTGRDRNNFRDSTVSRSSRRKNQNY